MLRRGKITSLDFIEGLGEILDKQQQDIVFDLAEVHSALLPGDEVIFDIELKAPGLKAVNIRLFQPKLQFLSSHNYL